MEYIVDDQNLQAETFLAFVNQVWPGDYDLEKTKQALAKTLNITAYAGDTLVGLPAPPHGRLLFRHHYRALGIAGVSEARDRQPPAPTGQRPYPDPALLWRTARSRSLL